VAEAEAAVDPRLVALGLATEIVIEFPEGTVEEDAVAAEVAPPPRPIAPPAKPVAPLPILVMPAAALVPPAPPPITYVAPRPVVPVADEVPVVMPEISKAPPDPRPLVIEAMPVVAPEPLAESQVLLRTAVILGRWPRPAELTLQQLGFRVAAPRPVAVAWNDVTAIEPGRAHVRVRTQSERIDLVVGIDGVAAPELNERFAAVLSEARDGALDLEGTAVHELQNATDALRDGFHATDDAFIPIALGGALSLLTLILALALPELLSFATRPSVPANAFLLEGRLAIVDPRVLIAAVGGAAAITALVARASLGAQAGSWARGTLRGWHIERPSIVAPLRRALALVFLSPAVAAAAFGLALVLALPSARVHATVDQLGVQRFGPLPAFDQSASWTEVEEIVATAVSGGGHPDGLAVLIRSIDGSTLTTQDLQVRNGTDRYFYDLTRKWRAQAVDTARH